MNHVTKYTNSLRNYATAIVGVHLTVLGWLYPMVLVCIVMPPLILYLLFLWAELTYKVDVETRLNLLKAISEADNQITKDVLTWQLLLHEEHSIFGNNPSDRLGF